MRAAMWPAWLLSIAAALAACGNTLTVERVRPEPADDEPVAVEQAELEQYCEIACDSVEACTTATSCDETCSVAEAACGVERSLMVYCLHGQVLPTTCNMPADCTTPLHDWLACRNIGFDGSCEGEPEQCSCDVTDSLGLRYQTACDEGHCVCSIDGEPVAVCTQAGPDDDVSTSACAPLGDCCAAVLFVPGYPGDWL